MEKKIILKLSANVKQSLLRFTNFQIQRKKSGNQIKSNLWSLSLKAITIYKQIIRLEQIEKKSFSTIIQILGTKPVE